MLYLVWFGGWGGVLLHHYLPCGFTGRVLQPNPSAYRQRQGTPLDMSPANRRALSQHLEVHNWDLNQGPSTSQACDLV